MGTVVSEQDNGGADLAALGGEAAALDAEVLDMGPAPAGAAVAAPAGPDRAGEMAAAVQVAVGLLGPVLPYLPGIYTPEVCQQIGAAYAPLAAKYGWDMGDAFREWGPEIGAAAVAVPLALATARAHRAWITERDQAARVASMNADLAAQAELHREMARQHEAAAASGVTELTPA